MAILHLTRTLPALLPRYVTRFSCIGPACEDTCCSGWTVSLDKKTFTAYRASKHPELSKTFSTSLRRQDSQQGDLNYGKVDSHGKDDRCPMMQDGLCSVQIHLNESYLSNTCFSYPRISANFSGQVQQALQLSCPEAARQALLAPDAFDFIEGSITERPDAIQQVDTDDGTPPHLVHDVRIFCLQLMRTEGMELWERLALLGVFCERLATTSADGITALLDEFAHLVNSGAVLDALRDLQPNHPAQALVFATLWSSKESPGRTERQREVIGMVARNLGADDDSGVAHIDALVARYTAGVLRLPQALEAAPHLLEHFVLNEMFMHLFPFDQSNPYDCYLELVSRYGLLRMMLAAQCAAGGALPDSEALVKTVQVFCRRFRHDPNFSPKVNQALKNSGWDTLDKLYGFLRH